MSAPQIPRDQGTTAFSGKAGDYQAARPSYPQAWFAALEGEGLLGPGEVIADIGAGTGLLTAGLLDRGAIVTAVEPNDAMRYACDEWLGGRESYSSVSGTAENTSLLDASVDLITAAQAFHWFQIEEARREFLRILKPAGLVALIWNDRIPEDPLQQALAEIMEELGGVMRNAVLSQENKAGVPAFFNGPYRTLEFSNEQLLTREGLHGLLFSRSYMPRRDSVEGARVVVETDRVFDRFVEAETVRIRYRTVTMLGRPVTAGS
ncbi:class I SAM-dependent methyltransferase [Luteolibacter ambystomatis]|uniref:Class I SAM-dependent methyltransferase n=1 Tax=Luteolibacter ambystomatis TaxID=2824561 RepID=A0A975IZ30_9BACT|nr:class I SAM-dependent methyltransferase [Luteolibacter ambystomatis]QUE50867.1 class I SAM-dependent methyltransferase [Luteolibacter ambystomatis]